MEAKVLTSTRLSHFVRTERFRKKNTKMFCREMSFNSMAIETAPVSNHKSLGRGGVGNTHESRANACERHIHHNTVISRRLHGIQLSPATFKLNIMTCLRDKCAAEVRRIRCSRRSRLPLTKPITAICYSRVSLIENLQFRKMALLI